MRAGKNPPVEPLLSAAELRATADAIAAVQEPDGAIPWFEGGHTDAWDHLECAMALLIAGRPDAADAAWEWLYRNQRPDGSWATSYIGGSVKEDFTDSNQCAYVAAALWHRWLVTGDRSFVDRMWPVARAALDLIVDMQAPDGQIWWARDPAGKDYPEALVTGCSSTLHSLRCGMGLAALVDDPQPAWEITAGRLWHALRHRPELFMSRSRWSMDWYYPVIGGVLHGADARAQLRSRWDEFVVDDLGIRCVDDEPWVTGAETCELAIALYLADEPDTATQMVRNMQHLRTDSGAYWTGWQFAAQCHWPEEQSTWTSAAVILAVDTLAGGPTARTFRGDGLPEGLGSARRASADAGTPRPGSGVATPSGLPAPRDPTGTGPRESRQA